MREFQELLDHEKLLLEDIAHTRWLVLESYHDIGKKVGTEYNDFFTELESRYLNA